MVVLLKVDGVELIARLLDAQDGGGSAVQNDSDCEDACEEDSRKAQRSQFNGF